MRLKRLAPYSEVFAAAGAELPTFFQISLGCKSSPKVQRTSDYQSKRGFPDTLDRSPEVVDNR